MRRQIIELGGKLPCLPSNVKRCPAITLAASRIAKVKGRIIDLTNYRRLTLVFVIFFTFVKSKIL
jgi:hypothetical protein